MGVRVKKVTEHLKDQSLKIRLVHLIAGEDAKAGVALISRSFGLFNIS